MPAADSPQRSLLGGGVPRTSDRYSRFRSAALPLAPRIASTAATGGTPDSTRTRPATSAETSRRS